MIDGECQSRKKDVYQFLRVEEYLYTELKHEQFDNFLIVQIRSVTKIYYPPYQGKSI